MSHKIFLIAGEASGDLLGSKLIKELKLQYKDAEFIGVGGKLMKNQGLKSIFPMEDLSVMGFFEVLPHIFKLLKRIKETAQKIRDEKPDLIITIDSPDFNFRVMKKLQDFSSAKKIHLIAPSVWAYREGRAKKIAKLYDLLLTILPFEPPYFTKYGLKAVFIGHPLVADFPDVSCANNDFRKNNKIADDEILLCLTPGSRVGEVKRIFPEFIKAVNLLAKKNKLKVVIPLVEKTQATVEEMAKSLKVEYFFIEQSQKQSALFSTDFALAKSGTNTLEFSLYKIPMIIAYKVNFLTFVLAKLLLKVKFANLINLIANKEIIPEMIQQKCNAADIFIQLEKLIANKKLAEKQILESEASLRLMGLGVINNPSKKAVEEIIKL